MPRSTASGSEQRAPSQGRSKGPRDASVDSHEAATEKFPDFESSSIPAYSIGPAQGRLNGRPEGYVNGGTHLSGDQWRPRRESSARGAGWAPSISGQPTRGHARQKSINDTLRDIRARGGSVSQNAHELAGALRAPVSPRLIILCITWYASSALTNTSAKSILNAFDKPATLTMIQFLFVSGYCMLFSWAAATFPAVKAAVPALRHGIRPPSVEVIRTTMPLALFQVGGHLLSSNATSKIPVSLVHTIKGLSPLFTVLAYRAIYDIRYPVATYLSLIPLTIGVMLACSGSHSFGGQLLGILYAFLATLIFVTQNIFSKRLFNEAARAEAEGMTTTTRTLDKLNLLCYSSGLAFVLTSPIWLWSEGFGILGDFLHDGAVDLEQGPDTFDHGRLFVEFVFNGSFHFGQNILAFVLLSLVSPVTYSVASLIKRVFVIVVAIVWFRSPTTRIQAVGIGLTFLGLYFYDRSSEKNKADRKARTMTESKGTPLLPLNTAGGLAANQNGTGLFESPAAATPAAGAHPYTNGFLVGNGDDSKKSDDNVPSRARAQSSAQWLPPGTKQEETWRLGDKGVNIAA
ncbi:TPT-domain-containing protein [Cryphonectria parasitica EP155]|uniref:TPT-domain-containing protein n=1 Tax=Cryphonectria parasitica (strain ATCC 38755 / EP155) TaxID=660469 RepID=A0A9P4Y3P6_CRYP1|nr:TPT-domain-containing protein [Cryphonectria parasitica EP155]KAF3765953.1 TPT-domain-containing protein [Cryphonectria parasitica EP155]